MQQETEKEARRQWLETVMDRWEATLLRLCFAYLGDRSLAEDAVQETFLKAWKGYDGVRGRADDKTWLTRIAINQCKDMLKSAWNRHTDRSVDTDLLPEAAVPFEERDDTVTRAVMALPVKLREAALVCLYQGLSLAEASKALRLPRSTVHFRLQKAEALLKEELEEWFHAD